MASYGLLHSNPAQDQGMITALKHLAEDFGGSDYHLKNLLARPDRFSDFSAGIDGFFMDYSRQRIDRRVMEQLYRLALSTGAPARFREMTEGARVNTTERRAALHTAARGTGPRHLEVDGMDIHQAMAAVNRKIKAFCSDVHENAVTGEGGRPFTNAVVVGIGGSYLGCEFAYQAMGAVMTPKIPLHFMPNVDIDEFAGITRDIDPGTTLWIVISKSFTTTETLANFTQIKGWLSAHNLPQDRHVITITAKGSPGDDPANPVLDSFHMFDFIGGRYSVTSAVGGLPLSLAYGFAAFERFLAGCREMDAHVLDAEQSLPMTAACLSVWNRCFLDYPVQAVIPYSSRLSRLPAHIQQLHMESIGKSASADGTKLSDSAGVILFGEPGTNAQHSFFQLAHQGPGFPIDFIGVKRPGFNGDQVLSKGVTNHQELWANLLAQTTALAIGRDHQDPARQFDGNRPSTLIMIDSLEPENIGRLLAFYEARTVLEGFILGINPFDQFGVELGKTMAGDIREQMAMKNQNPDHDLSMKDPALKFYLESLYQK